MELDRDKINAAYKSAIAYHSHEIQGEAKSHLSRMKIQDMEGLLGGMGSIDEIIEKGKGLAGNFCDEWSQNKSIINRALSAMAWIPVLGPYIVKAQAAITVFDLVVVPVMCGTPTPTDR